MATHKPNKKSTKNKTINTTKLIYDFNWFIIIMFWVLISLSTLINGCFPISPIKGTFVVVGSALVYAMREQIKEQKQ